MSDAREATASTSRTSTRLAGGEANETNTVSDAREATASTSRTSIRLRAEKRTI
jgi:hypothetical protein